MVISRLHRNMEQPHAGTYTSMDVGSLSWTFGVAMGQYANQHLDEEAFRILVSMLSRNTQTLSADAWTVSCSGAKQTRVGKAVVVT